MRAWGRKLFDKLSMFASFTFWLVVLAILVAYLCLGIGLRLHAEDIRRRAYEKQHPGKAFDASAISPRIERVRDDFATAAHGRLRHSSFRAELLESIRSRILSLPYFCRGRHEHEQKRDA